MTIKVFRFIRRIEREWRFIIGSNVNVYRSYEYFELLYKLRMYDPYSWFRGNWRCYFVVGYENDEPKAIAPLIFDKYPRPAFHMLGHGTSIGNSDFIYRDGKYARELLSYIKNNILGRDPIELWRVDGASFLVDELKVTLKRPSMKVYVRDYETYWSSLSKKIKGNIRTAYNRLSKDKVEWRMETYCARDPRIRSIIHSVIDIYYTRVRKWQHRGGDYSYFEKFYLASRDIAFASLFKILSARIHLMYINGEVAFFIIGYECGGTIYLPHMALNEAFSRYSPGILTIIEWVREYSSKNPFVMDMGSGDEEYKKWLGGGEYFLYMLSSE